MCSKEQGYYQSQVNSFQLNDKQREAVDFMHKFMEGPDSMMVLEGFAGTGKTTCVQTFAEETDYKIAFTAPTNKATKVLRQMASRHIKRNVDTRTIYSLLGLVLTADGEFKKVDALGENDAGEYDVLIVDESSMVGSKLFQHIRESVSNFNVKIIFMGDPAQLPPVNEEHSPVFDLANKVTLSKVMRHDNQILALATDIRECIYEPGRMPNFAAGNDANGGVFIANNGKFRLQMEKGYMSETYKTTRDVFKTIAWRNVTVNAHNEFIRACLYGPKVGPEFQVGERIVACAPVADLLVKLKGETTISLHTDEEASVVALEVTEHPIYREIMCDKVILSRDGEDTSLITAYCVHESSKSAHKVMLERLADRAKKRQGSWSSFWDAKEAFHDLRPCHAITAHRSQGSTYQTVFVNVQDIMLNRDRVEALKCLYVAVTRASKNVILKLQ